MIGNDAVHLTIEEQFHRHEALFLKDLGLEVKLVVLPAVGLPFPAGVPLMEQNITIPSIAIAYKFYILIAYRLTNLLELLSWDLIL